MPSEVNASSIWTSILPHRGGDAKSYRGRQPAARRAGCAVASTPCLISTSGRSSGWHEDCVTAGGQEARRLASSRIAHYPGALAHERPGNEVASDGGWRGGGHPHRPEGEGPLG